MTRAGIDLNTGARFGGMRRLEAASQGAAFAASLGETRRRGLAVTAPLAVGELFAGIGGFGLGFRRAGFAHAFMVEWDPKCQEVLSLQFPGVPLFADMREVGAHNLPPCDVLTFGSPCQDLSVAGRRAGFDGERSGLFFEAVRIIKELRDRDGRPTITVWENVPGALSSNRGRDFAAALDHLGELGAMDLAWRVLDARYFGLAQKRRRVFLIGDFGAERAGAVLFGPESVRRDPSAGREEGEDAPGAAPDGARRGPRGDDDDLEHETYVADLASAISASAGYNAVIEEPSELLVFDRQQITSPTNRSRVEPGQPSPALTAQPPIIAIGDCRDVDKAENGLDTYCGGKLEDQSWAQREAVLAAEGETDDELGPTLQERDYKRAGGIFNGQIQAAAVVRGRVRRLTPTECARLQGFPDDWNSWLADLHRYRQFGNAVAVPIAEWIARRIAGELATIDGATS